ncbi:MAG: anthranilate phosphoribosyltransferase, partial [Candidatus Sumerlaeia bacterium]|nr:anthranilate phosphoribosyltransferase [Candidatus Sumerlaeia bacterium]
PAMRHAGPTRKEIRFRSIFNLAGPLSNPANPTHQLVGVSHHELMEPIAETLRLLGRRRALVVHGANGEDEISLTQITRGLHLTENGDIEQFYLEPSDLGLQAVEMAELVADGPEDSAEKIRAVLEGQEGPISDVINLNLAAVLYIAGHEDNMKQAFNHAREVQLSGRGAQVLQHIIQASKED